MADVHNLTKKLLEFRETRGWEKYHNPKDLALSLVLEATEVLELFQWKNEQDVQEYIKTHKRELEEELADVFNWVLVLAHDAGIDILEASENKITLNNQKYPIEKTKGDYKKYTNL